MSNFDYPDLDRTSNNNAIRIRAHICRALFETSVQSEVSAMRRAAATAVCGYITMRKYTKSP